MNDNLTFATFLATVLNLEVNVAILKVSEKILMTNEKRIEQGYKHEELLSEIIGLLKKDIV